MNQNPPPELNATERELLKMEYEQLCQDYRQHDKYVLDKLTAAGILFGLLGIAVSQIQDFWIKIVLLFLGGLFGCICSISVAKDTYYRDGYGKIITGLSKKLGIWDKMKNLNAEGYFADSLKPERADKELQLLRQIHIKPEKSSIVLPRRLRNFLINRKTFRWILFFYLTATVSFWGILVGTVIGYFLY
ncbi:MAG: hypothetical protein PHY28_04760 [Dehalococcoidales bacterium]|nr:hypothetical protein [Dehalococcoidales bacterium]